MKECIDSDRNLAKLAMHASNAFEQIIDQIRTSNLNFQLTMSPFSAQISLKKSLIIDKSGNICQPRSVVAAADMAKIESDCAILASENDELKKALKILQDNHDRAVNDCHEAHEKIKVLEKVPIKTEYNNMEDEVENLKMENNRMNTENFEYSRLVKEQSEEICDLRNIIKTKSEVSNNLNKKIGEIRIKSEKNIAALKRSHKVEVKFWRKELGEERKQKMKLEDKLDRLRTSDDGITVDDKNTDDEVIVQLANPSSLNCDDTSAGDEVQSGQYRCEHPTQCVIRQPYPPPSPSFPYLVHEVSRYHEHMMEKSADDLVGCINCFSVNNENYGCDKCTWLKWWFKWHGDRHGLPDIHPSVYKKYQ